MNNLHKQDMPGRKALLVISNGRSIRTNGYLDRVEEQLSLRAVESVLFDRVESNPLVSTVMEGGLSARENGCDMVVALGGGSVIDAAKAIAVTATNEGDYWDYVSGGMGKAQSLKQKPLPVVTIPTTAGTGSETDAACVVTNDKTHEKTGFGHPSLYPVLAVIDPELMLTVPPTFTAYQGFDALFHSIEGYVSNRANPMSDLYALEAIGNVSRYLPEADKPEDFIAALEALKEKCGVADLKMSDYGISRDEASKFALNAKDTMGRLFTLDRITLSDADCQKIYKESYK